MDREKYIAAIDALESALCERYRVPSLDGIGVLGEAIAAARSGNLAVINRAMDGREMYRWADAAAAALSAAQREATVGPASVTREAPAGEPPTQAKAEPPPRTRKRMEKE